MNYKSEKEIKAKEAAEAAKKAKEAAKEAKADKKGGILGGINEFSEEHPKITKGVKIAGKFVLNALTIVGGAYTAGVLMEKTRKTSKPVLLDNTLTIADFSNPVSSLNPVASDPIDVEFKETEETEVI